MWEETVRKYNRNLVKIHKLKRENVKLGQKRTSLYNRMVESNAHGDLGLVRIVLMTNTLLDLSEKIGKNSAKILRLRTLNGQMKAWCKRKHLQSIQEK